LKEDDANGEKGVVSYRNRVSDVDPTPHSSDKPQ